MKIPMILDEYNFGNNSFISNNFEDSDAMFNADELSFSCDYIQAWNICLLSSFVADSPHEVENFGP